jgi:hypothetical protein
LHLATFWGFKISTNIADNNSFINGQGQQQLPDQSIYTISKKGILGNHFSENA